jgi:hemoglobin-like flavoprotein
MSDRSADQGNTCSPAAPSPLSGRHRLFAGEPEHGARLLLIRLSFQKLLPVAAEFGDRFYEHLFRVDPTLRQLFKGDIREQGRKLVRMLATAVQALDHPERLVPVVEALGTRHHAYGVRDEHYDTVRLALLHTLGQLLGDDVTPAVAAAWADVYDALAALMKGASRDVAEPAAKVPVTMGETPKPPAQPAPPSSRKAPPSQRIPVSQPPPS